MASTFLALRDPVFYRWHQHIDDIFERHKTMLEPYPVAEVTPDPVQNDYPF
jgi:tyrosinase